MVAGLCATACALELVRLSVADCSVTTSACEAQADVVIVTIRSAIKLRLFMVFMHNKSRFRLEGFF